MANNPEKDVWLPLYTNSIDSIADLFTYLQCNFLINPNEEIQDFYKKMDENLQAELYDKIVKCQSVEIFEHAIKLYTFNFINLLEKCLFDYFMKDQKLRLKECSTPCVEITKVEEMPKNRANYAEKRMKVFFQQKEQIHNLARKTPEKKWFNFNKPLSPQYLRFLQAPIQKEYIPRLFQHDQRKVRSQQ